MKSKQQKREEGEKRNAEYAKLTQAEKLKQLDVGQYTATKQRAQFAKKGGIKV